MAKTQSEVWRFNGLTIERIEGAKLGERMVTLPGGQRWSREGHSLTDQYGSSEAEVVKMIEHRANRQLGHAKRMAAEAESAIAECARVLAKGRTAG